MRDDYSKSIGENDQGETNTRLQRERPDDKMSGDSYQTKLGGEADDSWELDDIDWTFEGADTQRHTHGLHSYPARMVPQIPERLLSYYKREGIIAEGDLVYDPFSGSGTTAVEARLAGLHAEANDINPLAVMLSLAKARPLERDLLATAESELLDGLRDRIEAVRNAWDNGETLVEEPEVRDGWFPEPQLYELIAIREHIDELPEILQSKTTASDERIEDVVRFLRVPLSSTTRKISYQRNGEYKRYRMAEEDREDHDPDVWSTFRSELKEDLDCIREYSTQVDHSLRTEIHYADSRQATDVETDSVDIVITSPPYGDHGTTVAYGQFSQDPAIVANERGYDEMREVDKTGLGGSNGHEPVEELRNRSESLSATLATLEEKDGRATDALDFFTDYYAVMEQVARVLKPGQPVAWVVANRTMSRVPIPTHLITRELCEYIGFDHQITLPREIPTKTLPWENAPENVEGKKGKLMADENVVVMTAPEE